MRKKQSSFQLQPKQIVIAIEPKDLLYHSSKKIFWLFHLSLAFLVFSFIFTVLYFTSRQQYKDLNQKTYYIHLKPEFLITSLCFVFLGLVCLTWVSISYFKIFGFKFSPTIALLFSLIGLLLVLGVIDIIFLLHKEPCTDPRKYLAPNGKCVCMNNMVELADGTCGCDGGSYLNNANVCVPGCRADSDCVSGVCNPNTGQCCAVGEILCGDGICCKSENCDPKTGTCCADPTRQCIDLDGNHFCCELNTKCVDHTCQSICGNMTCAPDSSCFEMEGNEDTLQAFQKGISSIGTIQDGKLYFCTPSTACAFDASPQFMPNPIPGSGYTFYPCVPTENISQLNLKNPDPNDPTQPFNICVTSNPEAFDDYNECWKRLRPDDKSKPVSLEDCTPSGDNKCKLMNMLTTDLQDPANLSAVQNALFYQYTPAGTENKSYKGRYCGEGTSRIISNKIKGSSCKDSIAAAKTCAESGAYANAKYTYFGGNATANDQGDFYCNTNLECGDISNPPPQSYFQSYTYNNKTTLYPNFKDSPSPSPSPAEKPFTTNPYSYQKFCPTTINDSNISEYANGDIGANHMCPSDPNLQYIQTKCTQTSSGEKQCNSDFCTYDTQGNFKFGDVYNISSSVFTEYLPVGIIIAVVSDILPVDYLECNGQSLNASDYPDLANVLGGATGTITLPDLSGRMVFVMDAADPTLYLTDTSSSNPFQILDTFGKLEVRNHNHSINNGTCAGIKNPSAGSSAKDCVNNTLQVENTGSTNNDRYPPYLVVKFILKVSKKTQSEIPSDALLPLLTKNAPPSGWDFMDSMEGRFLIGRGEIHTLAQFPDGSFNLGEQGGSSQVKSHAHTWQQQVGNASREYLGGAAGTNQFIHTTTDIYATGSSGVSDTDEVKPPFIRTRYIKSKETIHCLPDGAIVYWIGKNFIPVGFTDLYTFQQSTLGGRPTKIRALVGTNDANRVGEVGGKMSLPAHSHLAGNPGNAIHLSTTVNDYPCSGSCSRHETVDGSGNTTDHPGGADTPDIYPPGIVLQAIVFTKGCSTNNKTLLRHLLC